MKVYVLELSGNCYKVRLLAALLDMDLEVVPVDFLGGAHKRAPYIDMNPFGELPILEDGELVLRDSQAILVYLAKKAGRTDYLPEEAGELGKVMQWLSTAADEIRHGPNDARLVKKFGYPFDHAAAVEKSAHILGLLEAHLGDGRSWLELDRPTVADIAIFPYVSLVWEGEVSLEPYPKVRAWLGRMMELPNFIPMPGLRAS